MPLTTEQTAATARDAFALAFDARPAKWSAYNLSRMLRRTGDTPARVAEMRAILDGLGLGSGGCDRRYYRWISMGGVFDHGEMWSVGGLPSIMVGHPYGLDAEDRAGLTRLGRFGSLRVSIDDRSGYYGHGSHHVRVELAEVNRPFVPFPSTPKTRAFALAARAAFVEAFAEPD